MQWYRVQEWGNLARMACGALLLGTLLPACKSSYILLDAARNANQAKLQAALQEGADPNRLINGTTPLLAAIYYSRPETALESTGIVRQLAGAGADLNQTASLPEAGPPATPLVLAVSLGDEPMVALLLELGADAGIPGWQGMTPLMEAARVGRTDIVRRLLQVGAQVDRTDSLGRTALGWAALTGRSETAAALLRQGASTDLADLDGKSPLDLARERNHIAVVRLLDR
jgi:ankyrin repeat protein